MTAPDIFSAACEPCAKVQAHPLPGQVGLADSNCSACRLRRLADGIDYAASRIAMRILPAYRAALEREFGADQWERGHFAVKACAAELARLRADAQRPA